MQPTLNILLIGPGAIGTLFGWHLQQNARIYVLPHRADLSLAKSVQSGGIAHQLSWQLLKTTEPWPRFDWVLVTCKANQVQSAVTPWLQPLKQARWLICCNGLGAQQWLADQLPNRVFWATTTEAALRRAGQVQHTGFGVTHIGLAEGALLTNQLKKKVQPFLAVQQPLKWQWHEAVHTMLWQKLALNAIINPITAVHDIDNGELTQPKWRAEIVQLSKEITAIAERRGQCLLHLANKAVQLAEQTVANHSSMRVDLANQLPSEIDFINGFLINQARQLDMPVPRLTYWYQAVLEASA